MKTHNTKEIIPNYISSQGLINTEFANLVSILGPPKREEILCVWTIEFKENVYAEISGNYPKDNLTVPLLWKVDASNFKTFNELKKKLFQYV